MAVRKNKCSPCVPPGCLTETHLASPSFSSQRQKPKDRAAKYEAYMPLCEVQQALKKGEVVEGVLRINPRNYEDSFISAPVILGSPHSLTPSSSPDSLFLILSLLTNGLCLSLLLLRAAAAPAMLASESSSLVLF
ncbi:hypothetical protein MRX96_002945 [Rhipicephalus microplus]